MKLVTLQCPKCSAKLEINSELNHALCNYCGYHFLVDEEIQKVDMHISDPRGLGRELELGRRSINSPNNELAQQVFNLIGPMETIRNTSGKVKTLPAQIESAKNTEKTAKQITLILFGVGAFLGLLCMFSVISSFNLPSVDGFIGLFITSIFMCAFMAAFFGCIPFIIWISNREKNKKYTWEYNNAKPKYDEASNYLASADINVVPPAYRSKEAMTFIYEALINQRAMTMQEAVNLYELELHNHKMEELQRINTQANLINAELNSVIAKTQFRRR